jgi:hypothetical protein
MKAVRSLLLVASALAFLAACSQPEDVTTSPSPQYGTALEDYGTHVATNEKGFLYTLGTILDYDHAEGETNYHEAVLKRFNVYGRELWSRKLGAACDVDAGSYPFGCAASGHGVSTDTAGNSYVLDGGWQDGEGSHARLKKFSPSGTLLWTQPVYREHDYGAESLQYGPVMATSAAGETFVAYYYNGFGSYPESQGSFFIKYSTSGQTLFTKPLVVNYPTDAFVAGDGSLYVVGLNEIVNDGRPEPNEYVSKLAKYSSAGNLLWQRDVPDAIDAQVAVSGNKVYVSTNRAKRNFSDDTNIITFYRYTTAGARVWRRTITPYDYAQVNGLSADASGNAYLSGYTTHNDPANGNLFGSKYTPWGSVAWTYTPNLRGTYETALDVSAADSGKVYLVGHTTSKVNGKNHGQEDAFLLRLDTAGKKVWSR